MQKQILTTSTAQTGPLNHLLRLVLGLWFGLLLTGPSFADWLALAADGHGAWGISVRHTTKKQAEAAALGQCKKQTAKKCTVIGTVDQLGYVALAKSNTYIYAHVSDTLEEAQRAALKTCAQETATDDSCDIRWTGINGVVREPISSNKTSECRPKTAEIRCHSNCVNGNCVLEYENGCKVRVQVSPQFDSFSNQWKYPAPAC